MAVRLVTKRKILWCDRASFLELLAKSILVLEVLLKLRNLLLHFLELLLTSQGWPSFLVKSFAEERSGNFFIFLWSFLTTGNHLKFGDFLLLLDPESVCSLLHV